MQIMDEKRTDNLEDCNWRPADVAAKLGCSPKKIYLLLNNNLLEHDRVGRSMSIPTWALRKHFPHTDWSRC